MKAVKIVGVIIILALLAAGGFYAAGVRLYRDPVDGRIHVLRQVSYTNGKPTSGDEPAKTGRIVAGIDLLSPDHVLERNFGRSGFIARVTDIVERTENAAAASPKPFTGEMTMTFHPDRGQSIDWKVEGADTAFLERVKAFLSAPEIRSRSDDVAVRLRLAVPGGGSGVWVADAAKSSSTGLAFLSEACRLRLERYGKVLSGVDEDFKGVRAYGKSLGTLDSGNPLNVEELTVKNPDYWRATMEMASQDPSVGFSNAYLHAADGRLSRAKIWLLLGGIGMDKNWNSDLESLSKGISDAEAEGNAAIERGVALHDAKKYPEAIAVYEAVLKENPRNAWALYEKSFALLMTDKEGTQLVREELYKTIRAEDPFYWQAYQGIDKDVINRKLPIILSEVMPFIQGKSRDIAGLERFAAGCEKIGLNDFAAQAYWKLYTGGRDARILAHFLDNLKALGLSSFVDFISPSLPKADPDAPREPSAGVLKSCGNELGLLCGGVKDDPKTAVSCLSQYTDSLSESCRAALK